MAAPDPTELGRKLRQHDNELDSLYELVDTGFRRVDARLDGLEANLDSGFAAVEVRFGRLEAGQQQILDVLRGLQHGGATER